MVQNKLVFFYCLFVFIGLTYAIPRSAAAKYRRLAPSLTKRQGCTEGSISCGSECCFPDEYCDEDVHGEYCAILD